MSNSNNQRPSSTATYAKFCTERMPEIRALTRYIRRPGTYTVGYVEVRNGVPIDFIPTYPVPANAPAKPVPSNHIPFTVVIIGRKGKYIDPTLIPDAADEDAWDEDEDYTEQDDDMPDESDFEQEEYEIDGDDDGEDWANGDDED